MKSKPTIEETFKVIPEGNRIIIKELPPKTLRTAQGIIIPESSRQSPSAEVVAISSEYTGKVSIGDKVFFQEHSGHPFQSEGFNYRILYAIEVLAIDNR